MNEFEFIARILAPLAQSKSALGLNDDAALVSLPSDQQWVITNDALVEGIHFTGKEPPELIAQKALRTNLSDLAAMGAKPYGYFMALMLPEDINAAWLEAFAQGLASDQSEFSITLLGGDTTRSLSGLSISITALGLVPQGKALLRAGAHADDNIYVSGTLGDAALGLLIAQGSVVTDEQAAEYLVQRYHLPQPRVALGMALRGIATACMDISDGLMQDLGHLCAASQLSADIGFSQLPLSSAARTALPAIETIVAGGDDYELLFTASKSATPMLQSLSKSLGIEITCIGQITSAHHAVRLLDTQQQEIILQRPGYKHF